MTSPLRRKRRITRRSFLQTSELGGAGSVVAGFARIRSSVVCAALALLSLAVGVPLRADDVARLQWGNAPTHAKKTGGSQTQTALKFVKPGVGGSASSASSTNSDAHIKLAGWDSSEAPRLTSGRETEPVGRSVVVNRDGDSADGIRSAQLPAANTNSNNSKTEDGLRSPFGDNAEPPQPNPLPMPGDNSSPALPVPDSGSKGSSADQLRQPSGQFQPILPSGPGPDQSPPAQADNDSTLKVDSVKAQESCEKSLENLRAYTVDKVKLNIAISGTEGEDYPFECSLDDGTMHVGRCWEQTTYMWKASAMCHKPLYFEDEQLERYGHSFTPCIEPFVSGAHFFATIPVLPYCMGVEPPNECIYALGHYRPGDCAPYMCNPIPLSLPWGVVRSGRRGGHRGGVPVMLSLELQNESNRPRIRGLLSFWGGLCNETRVAAYKMVNKYRGMLPFHQNIVTEIAQMYFNEAKWPKFKKLGRKQFILRYGVLGWGVPVAIAYAANMAFDHGWDKFLFFLIPSLILFPLCGIWFGKYMWNWLERKYASPVASK